MQHASDHGRALTYWCLS